MKYSIGLDIGITSVGYAVMLLDSNDEPFKIHKMGSRIFDVAENPKDGSPLAEPRRINRGMRRRLRRKRFRKERIKQLIETSEIMTQSEIDEIYSSQRELSDIYQLRSEALDRLLNKEEFVRLIIHFSQRRGFKSNRKIDSENKKSEAGKMLTAIETNKKLMLEGSYRTIGEMLFKDKTFAYVKRNKADDYKLSFNREDYCAEIRLIFESQRKFGSVDATVDFENKFFEIYLSQRSFDEGPGGNSIYGGNQILKMLGKCTFEKDEPRCVKKAFSFEYFNLLSKVNAIKIITPAEKRRLSENERDTVVKLAFNTRNLTYFSLRKALKLSESERFNISYSNQKSREETEKGTKFNYLEGYHIFKKAFGDSFVTWNTEKKNKLAYALTVHKTDVRISEELTKSGFTSEEIEIALTLPALSKSGNLSEKALNKIIPYMEEGLLYNEACEKAGYNFKVDDKSVSLYLPANPAVSPELNDIVSPVVKRAVSQTIKVINSIIRFMNESPVYLNLELGRELSKNFADRSKIKKEQDTNHTVNEKIIDRLKRDFGLLQPTGQDLIKLKLWEEQDGVCPYSLKRIPVEKLFERGYTDIDHIVPYSISFDDSYNNKVLVLTAENRQKSNRLPMEYLAGKKKDDFCLWVENSNLRYRKKQNLLRAKLTEDDVSGFKIRNLQDTQYISSFLLRYIKKYLQFAPNSKGRKDVVTAVNGASTAYVRKRWGVSKIRENGDTHHAIDAVVIACITRGMIQRISKYSNHKETYFVNAHTGSVFDIDTSTGEVINRFPTPYAHFRTELEVRCSDNPMGLLSRNPLPNYEPNERVEPIFVSRMPKHKVSGSAHKETARKHYVEDKQEYMVSKVALASLKLKDGEIENYFHPNDDRLLYNALKERLIAFGGKGEAAFKEPFYKPKSDGTQGPLVKKVKVMEKATLSVPVYNKTAVAANGDMVRVDVFRVDGKFYLVPIYVSDTVKEKLPSKAITRGYAYNDWKEMDDKDFVFSLYPNDLIKVTSKRDMQFSLSNKESTLPASWITNEAFVYYKSCGISTASITVINHDNTYTIPSLGVKTLLNIEKYQVDVLGNITKVNKEKRQGFR